VFRNEVSSSTRRGVAYYLTILSLNHRIHIDLLYNVYRSEKASKKQDLIKASYVALEITQILYEGFPFAFVNKGVTPSDNVKWFNLHIRFLLPRNSPVLERQEHHQYQNLQSLNSISLFRNIFIRIPV
jgi:hypothetical protein